VKTKVRYAKHRHKTAATKTGKARFVGRKKNHACEIFSKQGGSQEEGKKETKKVDAVSESTKSIQSDGFLAIHARRLAQKEKKPEKGTL